MLVIVVIEYVQMQGNYSVNFKKWLTAQCKHKIFEFNPISTKYHFMKKVKYMFNTDSRCVHQRINFYLNPIFD